jgi:4-amino-4-deoxy-L-arabinose transferase-like glycosyltransferase
VDARALLNAGAQRAQGLATAFGRRLAMAPTVVADWRASWGAGLPAAPAIEIKIGRWVAATAVVWMAAVAAWGINGRFGDGHFASSAAMAVAGDNMWRHGILYPIHYYSDAPSTNSAYMHHPLGVYWVAALAVKIFGAHDWVLRLPAVVYSTCTPLFIYLFGRAAWGPLQGAVAALAYASLPITLGFSNFHALEGPVIAGITITSWGYARFTQTWRASYAVASFVGFTWAINHDWAGYVWGALFLSWVFIRGFLLPPRLFGAVEARPLARYFGLMVGVALLSLVVFGKLLIETGKLNELLQMYAVRSAGKDMPMSAVLKARHVWIHMMFPGLAILIGKLAVPVVAGRFLVRRNDLELFAVLILLMASFQYLNFKQGADVHIFWPQYFALYFALAIGALAATLIDLVRWARPRLPVRLPARARELFARHARWIAAGVVALPVLAVFKDGAWMIRLAQESGGRFVSTHIKSDIDRVDASRWWLKQLALPDKEKVAFHGGITPVHWSLSWSLRPHQLLANQRPGGPGTSPRAYVMDSRFSDGTELKDVARQFRVDAVGCFWFIDRSAPPAPLVGFSFEEREPGPLSWYVGGGTEPVRTVRPDPWVTWEWRTLLGQTASVPTGTPATPEQIRVAHNAAVTAGDQAGAARLRGELARRFKLAATARFDDGSELLGGVHGRGAERSMTLYFLAGPKPMTPGLKFLVSAKVMEAPRLSTLPLDPDVIEVGLPFTVPTELWRPGQIYSVKFTYRKRPGKERFFGNFVTTRGGRAPSIAQPPNAKTVDLATL